jgi:membrane protein YdbS with pleckstrin-like domain
MGFPQRLLGEGEHVILHMRTHVKALIVPVIVLLAAAAAVGFGFGALGDGTGETVVRWGLVIAGVALVARFGLWPFLVWLTTTYTVTSERLITRQGVISRHGRDIPLGRINDVAYRQDLVDRMLRCGSLNVSAASEQGTIVLRDVPRVHAVQLEMSELVREAHGWAVSGRPPGEEPEPGYDDVAPAPGRPAGPDAGDATGRRTRPLASDEPYDWRRDADLGDPGEP